MSINRRTFLKSSSLVAAAIAVSHDAVVQPCAAESTVQPQPALSPVDFVNILQGTDSTPNFSRGNTLPIAALPFGMAHWTLQSKSDTPWMFSPAERRLQGFRCTHQLSPWLGDYGHAVFLPCCGEVNLQPEARASSWRPEQSSLTPYSIKLRLMRYAIDTELVPTERCTIIQASYSKAESPRFLIDLPGDHGPTITDSASKRFVRFTSTANKGGVPEDFATS